MINSTDQLTARIFYLDGLHDAGPDVSGQLVDGSGFFLKTSRFKHVLFLSVVRCELTWYPGTTHVHTNTKSHFLPPVASAHFIFCCQMCASLCVLQCNRPVEGGLRSL